MSDLDLSEFLRAPACLVAAGLERLPEADRRLLEAALAHPQAVTTKIANGFRDRGISVSKDVVARHRRGECACARSV